MPGHHFSFFLGRGEKSPSEVHTIKLYFEKLGILGAIFRLRQEI